MVTGLIDKRADTVLKALQTMLSGANKPRAIRSDFGGEFHNAKMRAYLKKSNIKHFFAHSPLKAQIVERFEQPNSETTYHNRNTYRYIDKLRDIINGYNMRPHKSLGSLSPYEVTKGNGIAFWNDMYINRPHKNHRKLFRTEG